MIFAKISNVTCAFAEDPGEQTMIENGQGEVTIEDVTEQVEGHQDLDETEPAETIEPEMDSMTRVSFCLI